jgi:hypothetical protein
MGSSFFCWPLHLQATSASAVQQKSDDDYQNNQSDGTNAPTGAHTPIQSATTAQQQQQQYDDEYGIHDSSLGWRPAIAFVGILPLNAVLSVSEAIRSL